MSAGKDPFGLLKEKISKNVKVLTADYDDWNVLLRKDSSVVKFNEIASKAKIDGWINDGAKIISKIKEDRMRFAHVNDKELEDRNNFLKDIGRLTSDIRSKMNSPDTQEKIKADKAKISKKFQYENPAVAKNEEYLHHGQQELMEVHNEQDLILDNMSTVLKSIGIMSDEMRAELQDQNKLLNDMNNKTDDVNNASTVVINRLQELLQTNDNGKLCAIGVLVVILIILIAIVFCMFLNFLYHIILVF